MRRDAAGAALRQRLPPAGLGGRQVQDTQKPRGVLHERLALVGDLAIAGEELPAQRHRVAMRGGGQLVDEALDHEGVERAVDRAPPAARHDRFRRGVLDAHVRDGVRQVTGAAELIRFGMGGGGIVERLDRRRHEPVVPGDDATPFVQAPLDPVERGGPVEVVLQVVGARPDRLHRGRDGLRDLDRLGGVVGVDAPPEAASEERDVQRDRFLRKPRGLRDVGQSHARRLDRRPDFDAVLPPVGGGVLRLHRGVRLEGKLVDRLLERRDCVAVVAQQHSGLLRQNVALRPQRLRALGGTRSFVPLDLEEVASLEGVPARVGHDGDTGRDRHDGAHPGRPLRGLRVEAGDLAAEDRAARDRGVEQPGHPDVDAVDRASVHLQGRVGARQAPADEAEILRILQRRVLRHRLGRRLIDQVSVGEAPAGRRMQDRPFLRPAGRAVDAPGLSRRGDQHGAGRRPGLPHRFVLGAHARASAGVLVAELRVGPGLLDAHARPVGVQLLCDDHRERGAHALAHLRLAGPDGHVAPWIDLQEGVRSEPRSPGSLRSGRLDEARPTKTEDQACAGSGDDPEEPSPADVQDDAHRAPPCAARWTALRMRW